MSLHFFTQAFEQADIAATDGDVAFFYQLLYAGEMMTKVAVAGICAGIVNDQDRHRYRQIYRLVHADSIGVWTQVLDEVVAGPTAQFLCPELSPERRELTQKVGHGTWQFEAVAGLDSCLRALQPERSGLLAKLEGRSWFWHFVELRNSTRGHGALKPSVCAHLAPRLKTSLEIIAENFSLFERQWAYLHRNLSGKFRVTRISSSDSDFTPLKSRAPNTWGALQDGAYIFLGKPLRVELLFTDADLADLYLPNGNFKAKSFETLSYLTNTKRSEPSTPYLEPSTQLPFSETQGAATLAPTGETFNNLPPLSPSYVRRNGLEAEVRDALVDHERHPIITLTGRGGIGKTSLALRVLHDLLTSKEFGAILWFSSRDVDLLPNGPKPVRPHLLNEKDMGNECKSLLSDLISVDDDQKGADFLANALVSSPICDPILFVFDNFETVTNPVELYQWIDTYVRSPNKVLITTRFREFRADYAIEIPGMEESEALALISSTAGSLGVANLIGPQVAQDIYKESDGHPYVIKILLGEIARQGSVGAVERVIASKDNILDALFERSFAHLSPAAQQVFLTLCSWRSTIPKIALEAVLLRPANEKLDVDAAIEELVQSSFIEVSDDNEEHESFIVVPLSAAIFGRKRLQASPWKLSVQANMELLLLFGAGQKAEISRGIGPRVERFFRRVASLSSSGQSIEQYLPILEYLSRRYARGWLLLAQLHEEWGGEDALEDASSATRRYIESVPSDGPECLPGWRNLERIARLNGDVRGELHALSEIAQLPKVDTSDISNAINRFNQVGKQPSDLASDERRLLGERLLEIAESRLGEADATDLSRIAWLCLSLSKEDRAKEYITRGLALDPENEHCIRLAERLGLV